MGFSRHTAYTYDQTLPFAASEIGIVGSVAIGRYFTKKSWANLAAEDDGSASA